MILFSQGFFLVAPVPGVQEQLHHDALFSYPPPPWSLANLARIMKGYEVVMPVGWVVHLPETRHLDSVVVRFDEHSVSFLILEPQPTRCWSSYTSM